MEKEKELNEISEENEKNTDKMEVSPEESVEPDILENTSEVLEDSKDLPEEAQEEKTVEITSVSEATDDYDITNSEEYTYKSRREKKGMNKKKKSSFKISRILIPLVLIVILLGAFLLLPQFLTEDKIASNV